MQRKGISRLSMRMYADLEDSGSVDRFTFSYSSEWRPGSAGLSGLVGAWYGRWRGPAVDSRELEMIGILGRSCLAGQQRVT